MIRTLGPVFRVFAASFAQFTSISAGTRRKYLSNFLALALAISGLQVIAISSAPTASALTWTNVTGLTVRGDLQHIRTSNDGSVIGAVSKGQNNSNLGDLYLSRDSGASWTTTTGDRYTSNGLYKLAISGDGNIAIAGDDAYIVRASYSGSTWSYSNRTWSNPTGSGTNQRCAGYGPNFNSFATSTNGSKWVAGARDESCVYTSDNSGVDWSNSNVGGTHFGSAISADGTIRITSTANGNLYRNSGSGWSAITTSGLPASTGWSGIACDSTCTKMAIYTYGGKIYTTSNSGANWSAGGSSNRNTTDLSMSSDGGVIVSTDGAEIYISKDLGATWSSEGQSGKTWTGVTVSGDGKKIYASARDGTIRKAENLATQTITFNDPLDMTFGAADQAITASSSSGLTVTLASTTTSVCTIVSNSIRIVTVGTCTVTANQAGNGVYAAAAQVSNNVIISKASSSITASGSTTFTYSGLPQGPATSTPVGSAGAVTYSYVGVAPTSYTASATKPTNAGSYSVTATVATDTNYLSASSTPYSFTISKSPLEITASSPTVSYGATKPTITATYAGLLNGDASSVVTGQSCDTVYTTTSPGGSLPATSCSGGTATNYAISYVSGAVIINKVAPTLSLALPANASTATFGTAVVITATVSKPGAVTFKSGGVEITGCASVAATTTGTCNWTPSATNSATVLNADFVPTDSTSYTSLTAAGSKTINVGKGTQAVTFSATSTNFNLGQTDTLTATVTAGASGTVTFSAGGNTLCTTGTLDSAGIASCGWTPTSAGTYSVTAAYSGDTNYVTATSTSSSIVANSVITYDANGGVGTAPTAFTSPGTSTTLPNGSTLSKSGYTFGGWSTTSSGTAVSSTYSSSISRTLYAVWTANQYVITYLRNNGTGSQTAGLYTTGANATVLPATTTFTRTGYSFGGWATSATSTTAVTTYSTSANVSFYAIWIQGTYTVTYRANSGSGSMADQTSNAAANLNANTFTYADHTFSGWNTSADGTGTPYSNLATYPFLANITLYAQWGKVITFSSQGASSGAPSKTSQNWSSGSINLATRGTMIRAGYGFGGWTDGITTYVGGASYTPTGGITLNPVWNAITYTITFNSNLATSGNVPANQSWTTGNTALTLAGNTGSPVLAKSGYTFGGWATTSTSTTPVTTYSTFANQTFYAIWTPISYTITYALNGGTSTLPTQANQQIYNTFTLAATPTKADYYFAGWSDSATATTYAALASYSITANSASAITLTAQWIPTYTLNYVLNGSTSTVTGEGTYNSGTVVTLTAAPTRTGYTFNNWLDSSNITHAALSSFTMLQNSVLQAQWTAILYPITYALNGATGTLPLQSSLAMNSPFTVATAPVRAGYTFGGWSDGTNTYPAGSTYVIGTSSVTLTAQWSAISYSVTYDLGGGQGTLPTQASGSISSTFTLPASSSNPTWIAHTFTGWSDGAALYAAGSTYTFGATDVTLTAQFSLNGYTQISYSLGANGAGALPASTSALEGNTIVVASGAGVTRANYAFAGWSDGSNVYQPGDVYLVGPEAAPITFEPSWTSGYNVSYATGSGFGIAPVDPVGRVTGSTFTVATAATLNRQGFTFTGWSDGTNVVQPGATYTVGSANITLTAQWIQNSLAGIPNGALTPLASFSIVNGVSPTGSFNFGSTTVAYTIPANALSAGTTVSIYGLTDFSSISGMLPTDKSVVSSTVISWLSADGTVPDASSPISMTITNSQIVPGTVVYAISGSSLVNLGTATSNGSITTSITSDPVIVILNAVVVTPPVVIAPPVVVPPVVTAPVVVAAPIVVVTPTITSLEFVENATKTGGKLVWTGTNIESVLFTGSASTYPAPFNYGAFTLSWDGTLVNMVAGVNYTMKLEVRSSTGGSASKTIEYTIAKPVVDNSAADAALKAAQDKAAAEKKAAEEAAAAALKIAQEKALAEAKAAADAAALKIAQDKAAAEAKAAADAAALKIAQDKAAAEKKAAEEAAALKVAQDKAAAEARAAEEAAALKVAEEKAAADAAALLIAKTTPVLNLFSSYSTAKYTSTQTAKMKKLTLKLEPATTLKCVGYINAKGTTAAKAKATALAQAKATCANAKKLNPSIATVVTTAALTKAPKPLVGAINTKAKYRVDLFTYKG